MQVHSIPHSVFVPQPPPLWYVTDGERAVGPVITALLVRGVEQGRVPDYCHVRVAKGSWRSLSSVREVAAFNSRIGPLPKPSLKETLVEVSEQMGLIRDEDEFLHDLTQYAVANTGAESAMLHCPERSTAAMVTRCILGPMPHDGLGRPLAENDLLVRAARLSRPVFGPPYGPTEDALAMRFAASRGGVGAVAMLPITVAGTVTAMLELARPGHAFRRSDLQQVERVFQRALWLRRN